MKNDRYRSLSIQIPFFFSILLAVLLEGVRATEFSSSTAPAGHDTLLVNHPPTENVRLVWEEELPSSANIEEEASSEQHRRRQLVSTEKSTHHDLFPFSRRPESSTTSKSWQPPHKLRTNRWAMHVHWRERRQKETIELEFSENGYVRWVSPSSTTTVAIGHWELASHGLKWNLPVPNQDHRLLFHGDLLLNPFGSQPRIIRGLVIRETPRRWFRPVVATFAGEGIGEDTADLSYRNRKSSI